MKNGGYSLGHSFGILAKDFCLQQALAAHLLRLCGHVGQQGVRCLEPDRTETSISLVKYIIPLSKNR
jgi:hypothetical protein